MQKDSITQSNKESIINMAKNDLELSSYDFTLPNELIATAPIMPKENAKLLIYHNNKIIHSTFKDLFSYIPKDYLIVLNDTKVINARLFANKLNLESLKTNEIKDSILSKSREIFYHKAIENNLHIVQIKGKVKLYDIFVLQWNKINVYLQVVAIRNNGYREVIFFTTKKAIFKPELLKDITYLTQNQVFSLLEECGKIPLPPYIKRESIEQDYIDYQSIFAKHSGSVAAPTASLHFSDSMFIKLKQQYNHAFITLHVGAGTFQPVNSENILNHKIHTESCIITNENAKKIMQAKNILCIGTTAMRSVEWLIRQKNLQDLNNKDYIIGENNIFLHPHNPPKKVKALLTNFHLPKSSLIMLVSSIIGLDKTIEIYNEAIKHKYRFYSYGDGMLII